MNRRWFLVGGGCAMASAARAADGLRTQVAALEREAGGRIGLAIHDTGGGRRFAWRAGERFPMCSTCKLPLAAAILSRADRGEERLDRPVPIAAGDMIENSPFSATRVGGTATVAELCAAAVGLSDNAAANLLLPAVGGPPGLTRFVRALGDPVTRLDRIEPMLNEAAPGDPRDTTTPAAMLATVERLLLGRALSPAARTRLLGWMVANRTGTKRLRAGLPPSWRIGDRTGAGAHGSDNEVAILWPPGRAPIMVAAYLADSGKELAETNAVHARLGGLIGAAFA